MKELDDLMGYLQTDLIADHPDKKIIVDLVKTYAEKFHEVQNEKEVLIISTLAELEQLLSWNLSQNHTKRFGVIQGIYSRTYSFMDEKKTNVLKWLTKNFKNV